LSRGAKPFVALSAALFASGCGYTLAASSVASIGPVAVIAGDSFAAEGFVQESFVAGAREELASAGKLAGCDAQSDASCPALVVELLQVEEGGAAPALDRSGAPVDRAVTITLRGRAFLRRHGAPQRRGGEEVTRESFARPDDPRLAHALREEVFRRAARRLGARVVRGLVP
jgi:hypothetical protein